MANIRIPITFYTPVNETERSLPQPDVPVIPDDAGLRISRENSNVDVIIQLKPAVFAQQLKLFRAQMMI